MGLKRTNLIMEFGPGGSYGGQGGGRSAGGFATPVSSRRFNTWPFVPNAKMMMQKEHERQRRRERLRELALGWYMNGGMGAAGAANGVSNGAAPGSIF
jgi:hypothetical protein